MCRDLQDPSTAACFEPGTDFCSLSRACFTTRHIAGSYLVVALESWLDVETSSTVCFGRTLGLVPKHNTGRRDTTEG